MRLMISSSLIRGVNSDFSWSEAEVLEDEVLMFSARWRLLFHSRSRCCRLRAWISSARLRNSSCCFSYFSRLARASRSASVSTFTCSADGDGGGTGPFALLELPELSGREED